jgi:L-lactate dehydrogenase complex protein LldG
MSARDNILNRLRSVAIAEVNKPQLAISPIRYEEKVLHFAEMVKAVGGAVVEMQDSLNATLATLLDRDMTIVSPLAELQGRAINPDEVADVHELGGEYAAVVRGEIGVAENGAVWIPVEGCRKAHLFACKHLVIVLNRKTVVDTMHDAIENISLDKLAYGAFVSGPSKTADIEQAMVMGAHGAMRTTVILY